MTDAADRRRSPRFSIRLPVNVLGASDLPNSRDLSDTGLFIETQEANTIGAPLSVRLVNPVSGESIPAICKVVRQVHDSNGHQIGLGLRFANFDSLLQDKVRKLLVDVAGAEFPATHPGALADTDVAYQGGLEAPSPATSMAVAETSVVLSFADLTVTTEADADYSNPAELESLAAQTLAPSPSTLDVDFSDLDAVGPSDTELVSPSSGLTRTPQLGLWDRARSCITEALAAERTGRPHDAARLLQEALTFRPPNAADIHIRLALLGLGALADLAFAEEHAQAAVEIAGNRPQARRILRAVQTQRTRPRTAKAAAAPTAPVIIAHRMDPGEAIRRRFIGFVALIAIAAAVGFTAWRFFSPFDERPVAVTMAPIQALVPAASAVSHRERLVVTVVDIAAWHALADKQSHLEQLGTWAQTTLHISEVIVTDTAPVLLARVKDGKAIVYR